MMPGESESCDGGGLGGSRPSSEIDAYGGIVSSTCVVVHPAASTITPAIIAAATADFRFPLTPIFGAPLMTVLPTHIAFNGAQVLCGAILSSYEKN
jgi:hypothetical protein